MSPGKTAPPVNAVQRGFEVKELGSWKVSYY
jgi:hypothetical protein